MPTMITCDCGVLRLEDTRCGFCGALTTVRSDPGPEERLGPYLKWLRGEDRTMALPAGADVEILQARRIRPMRGQVVVRELDAPAGSLWTPDPRARDVKTHRGVVLALGAPARVTEHSDSAEVPYGFEVGAVVQYHFAAVGTQASRTRAWTDGEPATWLCQAEVDAVWEPDFAPENCIACHGARGFNAGPPDRTPGAVRFPGDP